MLVFGVRRDADATAVATYAFVFHVARDEGEQRVVTTQAHAGARINRRIVQALEDLEDA